MYSSPGQPGEVKSYCYVYLPSKYYLFFQYVNLLDGCFFLNKRTVITDLRWLWQRGSPLPIPNRVVKPVSADGTAVLWESMSSPSSRTLHHIDEGFFYTIMSRSEIAFGANCYRKPCCLMFSKSFNDFNQ